MLRWSRSGGNRRDRSDPPCPHHKVAGFLLAAPQANSTPPAARVGLCLVPVWSQSGSSVRRGAMGAEVLERDCVCVLATDRCAGRATFSSSISAWRHRIDPKLWWCLSKARGYLVVRCWSLGPAERGRLGGRSAVRNPNASAPRPFPRGGACRRECLLGLGLGSEGHVPGAEVARSEVTRTRWSVPRCSGTPEVCDAMASTRPSTRRTEHTKAPGSCQHWVKVLSRYRRAVLFCFAQGNFGSATPHPRKKKEKRKRKEEQ